MKPRIVCIAGPTAVGKSALAVELARRFGGEVVNADSQQVYRGMDIGTGKPTEAERGGVPHHLFDLVEAWEQLDAVQFAEKADDVIADIASRGRLPVVVGGTGLWLRTLLKGIVPAPGRNEAIRTRLESEAERVGWPALHARLAEVDPVGAERIRPNDPVRIIRSLEVWEQAGVPFSELQRRHALGEPRHSALRLALSLPMEELEQRIRARARQMFESGLIDETRRLAQDPRTLPRLRRVMGYREAMQHIEEDLPLESAVSLTAIAQRQYAKRQLTWFRGESEWTWLRPEETEKAVALCVAFIA